MKLQEPDGLKILNRIFQQAFMPSECSDMLEQMLACIGRELSCGRVSIFEYGMDGTFDNTCEWCAEGETHQREIMHGLPESLLAQASDDIRESDFWSVEDIGGLESTWPEVYGLLLPRGTHRLAASRLAYHGECLGFFLLENPGEETWREADLLMPGLRYLLSSLVYQERLGRRLMQMEKKDSLTGMGSLTGMKTRLHALRPGETAGLFYVETAGWSGENCQEEGPRTEQSLIRTAEVLRGIFGEEQVFRAAASEFLAVMDSREGISKDGFAKTAENLRVLLREHGLDCGVGALLLEESPERLDGAIRQIHMEAHAEASSLHTAEGRNGKDTASEESSGEKRASISLPRTEIFFRNAGNLQEKNPGARIMTVVVDLNYFKLYNDIFGRMAGNQLLEHMAISLQALADKLCGLSGYLGGDNFILCFPYEEEKSSPRQTAEQIYGSLPNQDGFSAALGIYLSQGEEPLTAMYDHALTALQEIKGSYLEHIRFYNADRYLRDRDDKVLLMAIREGMKKNEFIFYLQPQVREQTGKIVGAEALCRWKHLGQLVSPDQFIPVLEKAGMIFEIDCLIWEQVAAWIRSCRDRSLPVLPISVNVSRVDFFFTDIAEHFISLTEKYGIDPTELGIEITESAFADNSDLILQAVEKLHEAGFQVLMDDFGNGYSSLSMLHTMNLDVLKTDVKFMSSKKSDKKAISIVESVVSMAHMIGMLVITEGIETESQRESMIDIGENYAQGFLFYRPMPVESFEKLLQEADRLEEPYHRSRGGVRNELRFREMVHSGMISEPLLENLIGPAAVLKREKDAAEIQQLNAACRRLFGETEAEQADFLCKNAENLTRALTDADRHPGRGVNAALRNRDGWDIPGRVFLLYTCEEHGLYLLTFAPEEN